MKVGDKVRLSSHTDREDLKDFRGKIGVIARLYNVDSKPRVADVKFNNNKHIEVINVKHLILHLCPAKFKLSERLEKIYEQAFQFIAYSSGIVTDKNKSDFKKCIEEVKVLESRVRRQTK